MLRANAAAAVAIVLAGCGGSGAARAPVDVADARECFERAGGRLGPAGEFPFDDALPYEFEARFLAFPFGRPEQGGENATVFFARSPQDARRGLEAWVEWTEGNEYDGQPLPQEIRELGHVVGNAFLGWGGTKPSRTSAKVVRDCLA